MYTDKEFGLVVKKTIANNLKRKPVVHTITLMLTSMLSVFLQSLQSQPA